MNQHITAILDRFHKDVEQKLTQALTAILGHEPERRELRGRTRKLVGTEVVTNVPFTIYYFDEIPFLHVSGPRLDTLDAPTWTITALSGSEYEQRKSQQGEDFSGRTANETGSADADEAVFIKSQHGASG